MSGVEKTSDSAPEVPVVRSMVLSLRITVLKFRSIFFFLRWLFTYQWLKSTDNQHGNVADVKTSKSKKKKSTSTAVKLKDNNIKDSTARLQEKKKKNCNKKMQKQQKNKNVKNQNLEEKINQQAAQKLEIRRPKQEIHLNKEILLNQAKQIRKEELHELEKRKQEKKDEHQQLERKLLEEEKNLNNIPSPAIIDIPATLTEPEIAPNATDYQPPIQSCQGIIAEVEETENLEVDASVNILRAENYTELRAESKKMNKHCKVKIDKLLQTTTQVTQVTHKLHVVEATEKALKDITEIQSLCENNELSERLEVHAESEKEHDQKTNSISICAKKKNKKKIKNQRVLQELEQQLFRQELRRQRKEIQLNKEMLHRQEKQKRREMQQEFEKQHRLKKEEKRQQLERRRHDSQSQNYKAAPTTNDIAVVSVESVKESALCHSLQNKKAEVGVSKKQMCVEEDKMLQADSQKQNEPLIVKAAPSRITRVVSVAEVTHINNVLGPQNSVRNSKYLESSEKIVSKNFKNETFCEKHDSTIRDLREEIDNMHAKFMNIRTDIDFNIIVNEVRTECEINEREAIENLRMHHEMEVKNLHMYYNLKFNELHLNHGLVINKLQRNHEGLVFNLRKLNYTQGIRQEAALQSMRELRAKTRIEHQQEIQQIHEKYEKTIKEQEITIKDLIEEKTLLCNKHEKLVKDLREINNVLRLELSATMKGLRAEHEIAMEVLRSEIDSSVEMSSPDITKKNEIAPTEVKGLQRKIVEEEQQHTIITTNQQTTNGHDVSDADTSTNPIADNTSINNRQ